MNDYIGKVCPYCKTKFVPGDDIVVCSDCDMPHHKDCWIENQGCTTFGCLGTIKTAENETTSVTSSHMNYDDSGAGAAGGIVFCSQCGTRNPAAASFCARCGSRLVKSQTAPQAPVNTAPHAEQPVQPQPQVYYQPQPSNQQPVYQQPAYQQPAYQQPAYQQPAYQQPAYQQPAYQQPAYQQPAYQQPAYQQQNYQQQNYQQQNYQQPAYGVQPYGTVAVDPLLPQLVGPKAEYYLPKFQQLKAQGKKTSWNWAAFLVSSYWMLYRKMYLYGAIAAVIEILCSVIGSLLLSLLLLGGYIAVGIFANFIYMKDLEGKAEEARTMPEPYRTQFITTNGGINSSVVVLTAVGRIVFAVFLLAVQM